jgi:asparagine synthase (glutamine-hydrolysing)
VSKLAREHGIIVSQVGEGADELFCGYPGWIKTLKLNNLNEHTKFASGFKKGLVFLLQHSRSLNDKHKVEQLSRATKSLPIFWGGAEAFTEYHKFDLLHPRLKEKFTGFSSWEAISPIYSRFKAKTQDNSFLNWMTYLDLNFRLPELLLMRVDKMSMGVSLECREPFLDHKLVEFAMGIPPFLKYKNGESKYIFKKAIRGLVPDLLIDRKKQGFGIPLITWSAGKLGDEMRCKILSFCKKQEFFDQQAILRLCQNNKESSRLWYVYNFILWAEKFCLEGF